MSLRRTHALRTYALGISALALAAASPAAAQDAVQPAAAEEPAVGDIVVTARFRTENLQDTPLAITAMSADMMKARGYASVADVGSTAPSVFLRPANSGNGKTTLATIRGIGQGDYNFALEPAVGIYIDDVYHPTMFGSLFDLLDLERVEILRGPQGTLFGKNSIGGAIRLITAKPSTDEFKAFAEGTYGSYNRIDLRGMVNVPLVQDLLALRVSASFKDSDGYVDRIDFACAYPSLAGSLPKLTTNSDCKLGTLGGEHSWAGRAALRFTPGTGVEINLAAEIIRDDSEGAADTLIHVNTAAASLAAYNKNVLVPTYGIPYDGRFIVDPYVSFSSYANSTLGTSVPSINSVHAENYSGDVTIDISDHVQLKSVTSYGTSKGRFTQQASGAPLPLTLVDNQVTTENFTQELRLMGSEDGFLEWTAGAFYLKGTNTIGGSVQLTALATNFSQNDRIETESKSVFAHGVFTLTDSLNLTLGWRYSDDWKSYRFDRVIIPSGLPFFPGGPFAGPPAITKRFDYKATVDYRLSDEVMVYGQFSTGYKGGGINPRPLRPALALPFGPETVQAWEIGAKTDFADHRVRLNIAAYQSNYRDLQLSANGLDADGVAGILVTNAGKARIRGVEMEMNTRIIDELMFDLSGSYTDFRMIDLGAAAGVAGAPTLTAEAPNLPKWQGAMGLQYAIPLGNAGALTPRLDLRYQSRIFTDWTNNPIAEQPAYAIANARITWRNDAEDLSVSLAVTNLFDKFYYVNKFIQAGSYIFTGQPGRPREWAVTVRKDF